MTRKTLHEQQMEIDVIDLNCLIEPFLFMQYRWTAPCNQDTTW